MKEIYRTAGETIHPISSSGPTMLLPMMRASLLAVGRLLQISARAVNEICNGFNKV
jgi:hypothetical protein